MSLTDDWKAGKLEDGFYFIKLENGKTPVAELETWYKPNTESGEMEEVEQAFSGYPDNIISEVVAPCDYDELQRLKKGWELYSHETVITKQLRQLLKECKPLFFPYVKDMPLSRCEELNLLTRINAAIGESEE